MGGKTEKKLFHLSFAFTKVVNAFKHSNNAADIMGLQEVLYSQLKDLDYELNEEYKWVGTGRDGNNNGEFCPILYKRQALEVL